MKKIPFLFCLCGSTCALFCFSALLTAQTFTASLQGTVTDSSGGLVPAAKVSLQNEATNVIQTVDTNERGVYFFATVPAGVYRLTVERSGFQTFVRSGMQPQVQQQAAVDVRLAPGSVETMVTVSGEAPRLDTVNATLGRVVDICH